MTNTNKSSRKEEREWQDLQHEKKAYLKRVQEEEDATKTIKNYKPRCEPGGYYDNIYSEDNDNDTIE